MKIAARDARAMSEASTRKPANARRRASPSASLPIDVHTSHTRPRPDRLGRSWADDAPPVAVAGRGRVAIAGDGSKPAASRRSSKRQRLPWMMGDVVAVPTSLDAGDGAELLSMVITSASLARGGARSSAR
jgi:hypothetical protein